MDGNQEVAQGRLVTLLRRQNTQPLHRYEVAGTRYMTASSAVAQADKIGLFSFEHADRAGQRTAVHKVDRAWTTEDDKPLSDVQAVDDLQALAEIEDRAELRREFGTSNVPRLDEQMAKLDQFALWRIEGAAAKETALAVMGQTMAHSPEYSQSLQRLDPAIAAGASTAYAMEQPQTDAEKDAIKDRDMAAMLEDPAIAEDMAKEAGVNVVDLRERMAQRAEQAQGSVNSIEQDRQATPTQGEQGNQVESDEMMTARQSDTGDKSSDKGAAGSAIPPEIEREFLRMGSKFYSPHKTTEPAFEDKGNKLETKSNSEQVAEAMVRIAQARGWNEIKVSGTDAFRREVWLEAERRGMHVRGYTPTEADKVEMAKRTRDDKAVKFTAAADQAKPEAQAKPAPVKADPESARLAKEFAEKGTAAMKDAPELAGAAAALALIDKHVQGMKLTTAQRDVVLTRVRDNLTERIARGERPQTMIRKQVQVPAQQRPQQAQEVEVER